MVFCPFSYTSCTMLHIKCGLLLILVLDPEQPITGTDQLIVYALTYNGLRKKPAGIFPADVVMLHQIADAPIKRIAVADSGIIC